MRLTSASRRCCQYGGRMPTVVGKVSRHGRRLSRSRDGKMVFIRNPIDHLTEIEGNHLVEEKAIHGGVARLMVEMGKVNGRLISADISENSCRDNAALPSGTDASTLLSPNHASYHSISRAHTSSTHRRRHRVLAKEEGRLPPRQLQAARAYPRKRRHPHPQQARHRRKGIHVR